MGSSLAKPKLNLLGVLDSPNPGTSPSTRSNVSSTSAPAGIFQFSSHVPVKRENMEVEMPPIVPQKRAPEPFPLLSTSALSSHHAGSSKVRVSPDPSVSAFGSSLSAKRPKLEDPTSITLPRTPLSVSDSQPKFDISKMSEAEVEASLRDTERSLAVWEMTRDSLRRKKKPSTYEQSRLRETLEKINDAKFKIAQLRSFVSTTSSSISTNSVKSEPHDSDSDLDKWNSSTSSPPTSVGGHMASSVKQEGANPSNASDTIADMVNFCHEHFMKHLDSDEDPPGLWAIGNSSNEYVRFLRHVQPALPSVTFAAFANTSSIWQKRYLIKTKTTRRGSSSFASLRTIRYMRKCPSHSSRTRSLGSPGCSTRKEVGIRAVFLQTKWGSERCVRSHLLGGPH